jgi:hypothetical protein
MGTRFGKIPTYLNNSKRKKNTYFAKGELISFNNRLAVV